MSYTNQIKLIQRLKQLPKQGNFTPPEEVPNPNEIKNLALDMQKAFSDAFSDTRQRAILFQKDMVATIGNSLIDFAKQYSYLEERNKELNNNFGITSKIAAQLGDALDDLSENLSVGGERAREYAISLNKLVTGFVTTDNVNSDFGKSLFKAQSYMRNNLKVTEQAALGYELYSSRVQQAGNIANKTSGDQLMMQSKIAEKIEEATGLQGVQKDLTSTIGSLASDLQLQYSRIPGSLELAVLKSRALGMSMADLNKTGTQLLNMESSIGDELEYQLLTGRRLIGDKETAGDLAGQSLTNAYREATIRGDANKQAEIMNQIIAQEGDTLQNNLFARQQMAKLLGTDEATLAKAVQKQQMLSQLGEKAQSLMNLSGEEFEQEAMNVRKNLDKESQKVLDELLASEAHDTRTTAERTADAVEKLVTLQIKDSAETRSGGAARDPDVSRSEQLIADNSEAMKELMNPASLQKLVGGILNNPAVLKFEDIIQKWSVAGTLFKNVSESVLTYGKGGSSSDGGGVGVKDISSTRGSAQGGSTAGEPNNDAVIAFNPNDNFTVFTLASTDKNQLEPATKNIKEAATGGNMSTISAESINMLAVAIQNAMSNINITVESQSESMNTPTMG